MDLQSSLTVVRSHWNLAEGEEERAVYSDMPDPSDASPSTRSSTPRAEGQISDHYVGVDIGLRIV